MHSNRRAITDLLHFSLFGANSSRMAHIIQDAAKKKSKASDGVVRNGIALINSMWQVIDACDIVVHNDCKHLSPLGVVVYARFHSLIFVYQFRLNGQCALERSVLFNYTETHIFRSSRGHQRVLAHFQCSGNINCCHSDLSAWAWCAKCVDYFATDMS